MAQVFSPAGLLWIKIFVIGAFGITAAASAAWYEYAQGPYSLQAPQQPIPFSHAHHAGDDGIDCRYCHASVETAAFAGLPSGKVCMTCHSQLFTDAPVFEPLRKSLADNTGIAWKRVNDIPGFAYFDHSVHVRNGVGCIECHGRVDRMPLIRRITHLDMQWCLACHRDPEPHLRAPARVTEMRPTAEIRAEGPAPHVDALVRARLTDCSTCHR